MLLLSMYRTQVRQKGIANEFKADECASHWYDQYLYPHLMSYFQNLRTWMKP